MDPFIFSVKHLWLQSFPYNSTTVQKKNKSTVASSTTFWSPVLKSREEFSYWRKLGTMVWQYWLAYQIHSKSTSNALVTLAVTKAFPAKIIICKTRWILCCYLRLHVIQWCWRSCQKSWNYEHREVTSDFNPPCKTMWKASDWQQL